jgi:long-chain fatty acid transport protein
MKALLRCCLIALVLGILVFRGTAPAQLGPAFSGLNATARDATTTYWNPAGMARIPNTQLVAIASVGYVASEFKVKPGTTVSGGDPEDDSGLVLIPSLYFSKPLGEKWHVGFSLNIPTGFGSDYGDTWAGRYLATESSLIFVNFSPVAAYRINDRFSLGGGLNIIYTYFKSEAAINNVLDGLSDGKVEFEGDGLSLGFNLGGLFELSSKTRFGLAYRSETEPDISATPEFFNLGPLRRQALLNSGVIGQEINADVKTPQNLQGGVYHEFSDSWSATLDVIWVDFSQFGVEQVSVGSNSVKLQSKFKDIWGGSIGARYQLSEDCALAVGVVYLSSGVDDEDRTLGLPLDRILGAGVGLEKQPSKKRRLHLNLNFYDLGEAPIDTQPTPLSGRVVGEFDDHWAILVDVGLVWDFLK